MEETIETSLMPRLHCRCIIVATAGELSQCRRSWGCSCIS